MLRGILQVQPCVPVHSTPGLLTLRNRRQGCSQTQAVREPAQPREGVKTQMLLTSKTRARAVIRSEQ